MSEVETEVQPEDVPVDDPQPETPAEETPAEGDEQPFDPQAAYQSLEQQMAQLTEMIGYVGQNVQQPAQPQAEVPQLPELDPFDPESVTRYNDARDQRLIEQMQGLVAPMLEAQQSEQAQQFVDQVMEQLKVPAEPVDGTDFSERDLTLYLSAGFRHQGFEPRQALTMAYDALKKYGQAQSKAGRTGQVDDLQRLRDQVEPVNGAGTGGVVQTRSRARTMEESARYAAAKLGIAE